MTRQERRLWYDFLRAYPVRFNRQKVLGPYVVDFYCASAKLVIEIDGSQHYAYAGKAQDAGRDRFLAGYGLRVVRIPNNDVDSRFPEVCEHIDHLVKTALASEQAEKEAL